MNTFFSGPDRPGEDGHQHSVCVCQEGLQVRLHRGVPVLPGELLSPHQLHLGQHDGQRRPGENTPTAAWKLFWMYCLSPVVWWWLTFTLTWTN